MTNTVTSLTDLTTTLLERTLFAEQHIAQSLPMVLQAAQSPALKAGLQRHLAETDQQIERLHQVFTLLGQAPEAETCSTISAIVAEGMQTMQSIPDAGPLRDAAIIAGMQGIEHYEISHYGTLAAWARAMGHEDAAQLLSQTLQEEKAADVQLTVLGTDQLNQNAHQPQRRAA